MLLDTKFGLQTVGCNAVEIADGSDYMVKEKTIMSRFNQIAVNQKRTKNEEGAVAYVGLDPEQQLYSITACNLVTNSFYKSSDQHQAAILDLVPKCDPLFVGKLAIFLRKEMYLRTVPMVLLVALALHNKLESWMVVETISRADEIKELLAAWQSFRYPGKTTIEKMPNSLKRGIAAAFNKFDGYHFRKYNKQGKEGITFKDALYLTHPKPKTAAKSEVFKKIIEGNLDPISTWETEISLVGSDPDLKRQRWESLLINNELPYMAALRNVRNMLQANICEAAVQKLLDLLGNEAYILKSKQFPFRWYSAFHELSKCNEPNIRLNLNRFQAVFEQALTIAINNIPGIEYLQNEGSLIACDVSGSMSGPLSSNSSISHMDIGILLGRMLSKKCGKVITGVFGDNWAPISFGNTIIGTQNLPAVGWSTYGYKVLDYLTTTKTVVDNVMFFSDAQIYSDLGIGQHSAYFGGGSRNGNRSQFEQSWNAYKKISPTAKIYMFDLASYGTYPIDLLRNDVFMVTGWSPYIFKVLGGLQTWKTLKRTILGLNN